MRIEKYGKPTPGTYNSWSDSDSTCNSDIDLESGELEQKVHETYQKDCRICHLKLQGENTSNSGEESELECDNGDAIELGCSCKGDLAGAHRQCAETWFKIRGNTWGKKVHENYKRDCRICHLKLVGQNKSNNGEENECSEAIELGCSCKVDLAGAHKQCAETWYKIRGNITCEICGATAVNVVGEQTNDSNATIAASTATSAPPTLMTLETQNFWHGRRLMNILLGCMVFAFIVSWLFHFNLLSHRQ